MKGIKTRPVKQDEIAKLASIEYDEDSDCFWGQVWLKIRGPKFVYPYYKSNILCCRVHTDTVMMKDLNESGYLNLVDYILWSCMISTWETRSSEIRVWYIGLNYLIRWRMIQILTRCDEISKFYGVLSRIHHFSIVRKSQLQPP